MSQSTVNKPKNILNYAFSFASLSEPITELDTAGVVKFGSSLVELTAEMTCVRNTKCLFAQLSDGSLFTRTQITMCIKCHYCSYGCTECHLKYSIEYRLGFCHGKIW